jgi:hypothetical protein
MEKKNNNKRHITNKQIIQTDKTYLSTFKLNIIYAYIYLIINEEMIF